jgi:hypothetical protein
VATPNPPSIDAASTPSPTGPTIILPPTAAAPSATLERENKLEPELAGETSSEHALYARSLPATTIGGYGELTLNAPSNGPSVVDLRRFVLFVGHDFTDEIRMYTELEVEHAVSSSTDRGEVEIEQAYLDGMLSRRLGLRAGLMLMPAGIVNVHHEPPSFNGVDRPDVDQYIIPSTWREPGVGIFGELIEGLRYQLYFVNGFDANGFTAESAIREGHQEAQLARAGNYGGIARLDYEPVPGTVLGGSAYVATSGAALPAGIGSVPVGIGELDARTSVAGWTARAQLALLWIGDAAALSRMLASGDGEQSAAGPIASHARGGYVELAYDVLHPLRLHSEHSLTLFARFDYADTQAEVPAGFTRRAEFRRYSGVFGLVWHPIQQIAIKADFRHRQFGAGSGFNEAAAALTWLF